MYRKERVFSMTIVLGILLLILILYIFFNRSVNLMEPGILFCVIILSTYFLANLHLSELQSAYPVWFSLLILSMIAVFYIGCKTANTFTVGHAEISPYDPSMMRHVVFILWVLILLGFIMTVRALGAPPAISGTERSEYFVSGWGSAVLLQTTLTALLLFDRYHQKATGRMYWTYMLSIILLTILYANKFQIIYLLVLILAAKNSYGKKIHIKNLLLLAFVIILLFIILFQFVYQNMYGITMKDMYIGYYMNIPYKFSFITQPYLYLAYNYENLYHYLISSPHHLYGYKTLYGVIDSLRLEGFVPQNILIYTEEWKHLLKVPSLTTGTMFEDFAQDGGIPLMFVLTYLAGMWSSFCYRKFQCNKNFQWFFLYASSVVAIFFSFFSNAFTSKVTLINIAASLLVGWVLQTKFIYKGREI